MRIALGIEYDGASYCGWQSQPHLCGVQDMLELALRCKNRTWQIISPYDNALRHMPKEYIEYFKRVRTERQIVSQTLWESEQKGWGESLQDVLMRKPRRIPKNIAKTIPSLMIAFDDKLLSIEGTTKPSAVLLSGSASVGTFNIIFELAWRSCREH